MKSKIKKISLSLLMVFAMVMLLPMVFNIDRAEAAAKISKKKVSLMVDETVTIKMKGTKKKVTWTSSDTSVASVSKGKITAKKEGSATITATVGKKKYTCTVTVKGDWKKIYRAALEKNTINPGNMDTEDGFFYVLNIDKKGVPELIFTPKPTAYTFYYVYTLKAGKLKYVGVQSLHGGSWTDPKIHYSSKSKGIRMEGRINQTGGYGFSVYTISNYKLKCSKAASYVYSKNKYYTSSNGKKHKKVSKKNYNKFMNKYLKVTSYYMYNINKYSLNRFFS